MNTKSRYLTMAIVVVLPFAAIPQAPPQTAPGASVIELIANPGKFDGKPVTVIGFLSLDPPDGNMLFLHEEDFDHGLIHNAIEIAPTKDMWTDREKLDMNYVVVVGMFRSPDKSHRYGLITDIKRCDLMRIPPAARRRLRHNSNP